MTTSTTHARLAALLAAGVIAALIAAPARADARLRWKFVKGQKILYRLSTRTETTVDTDGEQAETGQLQTMDMTWVVKDVDPEGRASMIQTIDRIRLTMEGGPLGRLSFDSADPKEPEGPLSAVAPLVRSMIDAPFDLKMSARGEIRDLKVPAKMLGGIKDAGSLGRAFVPMFSKAGIETLTTQGLLVFPEGAVDEGRTWSGTERVELPYGNLALDNTYTCRGASAGLAKVGLATGLRLGPRAGVPIVAKITSGGGKGSYTFDAEAGLLESSEVVVTMKLTVGPAGQTSVRNTEWTTSMALTRAEPTGSK